jgi:Uri superfamily endonuclease
LALPEPRTLVVGALGTHLFPAGAYLYVGSAFGPGGLRGRLAHHLRPPVRPHWHVDHLRCAAAVTEIWHTTDPLPREHLWAAVLAAPDLSHIPAPRFGASDCRCPAHLFHYGVAPTLRQFDGWLRSARLDHGPLQVCQVPVFCAPPLPCEHEIQSSKSVTIY